MRCAQDSDFTDPPHTLWEQSEVTTAANAVCHKTVISLTHRVRGRRNLRLLLQGEWCIAHIKKPAEAGRFSVQNHSNILSAALRAMADHP
jgi:hypothetical protein